jgi:hypothetical protein
VGDGSDLLRGEDNLAGLPRHGGRSVSYRRKSETTLSPYARYRASVESVNLVETSPVMKETLEDQAFARKY